MRDFSIFKYFAFIKAQAKVAACESYPTEAQLVDEAKRETNLVVDGDSLSLSLCPFLRFN